MTSRLMYQGVPGVADDAQAATQRAEMVPSPPVDSDPKLREECGVVAIHGHLDAAKMAYLGLYALQHRG